MFVIKRNGHPQKFDIEKIRKRISDIAVGLAGVDVELLVQETKKQYCLKIKTSEIDEQTTKICDDMRLDHWDYDILATRLSANNIQKQAQGTFSGAMNRIHEGNPHMIDVKFLKYINDNAPILDKAIKPERDALFNYNGFKTLMKKYLTQNGDVYEETPQYLYMRTAVQVSSTLDEILHTYNLLSQHYYVHATPTLMNSCMSQQLDSCFLVGTEDNIQHIMRQTVADCSLISKSAGGIGIHMSNIRARGQIINSSGGSACGVPSQMKIYESCAKSWDQGGRRPGSFAVYLEPWHADIFEFLSQRLNVGDSENRTRDLNLALWIPELFIERCTQNREWSLFSEDTAPSLSSTYGEEFRELYERYEREGRAISKVSPYEIINAIRVSIEQSGQPYLVNKDGANMKNGQQNIGVIKSSNLCTEIYEYSDGKHYATCTLASINLPRFISYDNAGNAKFDFATLGNVVQHITTMLDNVITVNKYPVPESDQYTKDSRPIGIGIQGLADVFVKLGIAFDSPEAEELDWKITECMYFNALTQSCNMAETRGRHKYFDESPASRGILHQDFENAHPQYGQIANSVRPEWPALRERIMKHGLRNSLLIALMPTASTSDIFGNTQSFEPLFSLMYNKKLKYGKQIVINRDLMKMLSERGLWTRHIRELIFENSRSIADIEEIPADIRTIFRTAFDINASTLMKRSALRGIFVDQGQSLNLFQKNITNKFIFQVLALGKKLHMKTISYYIHSMATGKSMTVKNTNSEAKVCSLKNREACEMCSS